MNGGVGSIQRSNLEVLTFWPFFLYYFFEYPIEGLIRELTGPHIDDQQFTSVD